jgi:uncharacterized membrane protein YkvA (DUF1232 family)
MTRVASIPVLISLRARIASLWRAFRDPATPLFAKAVMVGALLYIICPLDLIADVIPIIGWLDDAAMLPLAIAAFEAIIARRAARPR